MTTTTAAPAHAVEKANDLANVAYTAVMDHLRVDMPFEEVVANTTRSVRRAGGGDGWAPAPLPELVDSPCLTSPLVTVRGGGPGGCTALGAVSRFVVHPVLDGQQGLAVVSVVLGAPSPRLRAASAVTASAVEAALDALRQRRSPVELLNEFDRRVAGQDAVSWSSRRVVPLDEEGTHLRLEVAAGADAHDVLELAAVVRMDPSGVELLNVAPLRLVELS